MKDYFLFSAKLMLVHLAGTVISFITMSLVLSAEIGNIYKILIGFLFVAFIVVLAWNNASAKGLENAKSKNKLFWGKGFVCGACAMIPSIIVTVIYICFTFNGFESGASRGTADILYLILYFVFIAYCPFLASLVPVNPSLSIDFSQPAIALIKDVSMPSAVSAPMFFIPIVLFICVSGVAYVFGAKEYLNMKSKINIEK